LQCNKELIWSGKKPKKFCDVNCRTRYYYNKKYKAVKVKKKCLICSKEFETYHYYDRIIRFVPEGFSRRYTIPYKN